MKMCLECGIAEATRKFCSLKCRRKHQSKLNYERNGEAIRARVKEWRLKNIDVVRVKSRSRYKNNKHKWDVYRIKHKERIAERMKRWRAKNRERIDAYTKDRNANNKPQRNAFLAAKYNSNSNFRIQCCLRSAFHKGVRRYCVSEKEGKVSRDEMLGCSWEAFRLHLEKQFSRGMTWKNYGKQWHVDHVVPLSMFDLAKIEEQRKAWHFSNLRPLWKHDNQKKGNRFLYGPNELPFLSGVENTTASLEK